MGPNNYMPPQTVPACRNDFEFYSRQVDRASLSQGIPMQVEPIERCRRIRRPGWHIFSDGDVNFARSVGTS